MADGIIVNFEDWEKIDLRVAEIIRIETIPDADKLYKLTLNVGNEIGQKVVCAGIKEHYFPDELEGRKVIVFINLAPRVMKEVESQGMILAAVHQDSSGKERVVLIAPDEDIEVGSKIR